MLLNQTKQERMPIFKGTSSLKPQLIQKTNKQTNKQTKSAAASWVLPEGRVRDRSFQIPIPICAVFLHSFVVADI